MAAIAPRRVSSSRLLTALRAGTILGAGGFAALLTPGGAMAQTVTLTSTSLPLTYNYSGIAGSYTIPSGESLTGNPALQVRIDNRSYSSGSAINILAQPGSTIGAAGYPVSLRVWNKGSTTTFDLSGTVYGLSAVDYGAGVITVLNSGTIAGGLGAGINTISTGGITRIGVDPTLPRGFSAPISGPISGTIGINATAMDAGSIDIATTTGGTVTGTTFVGIQTTAVNGATTIDAGALVSGATAGVSATAIYSGAVTVTGSGEITGASGIVASSATGAITIAGTGATTATVGRAIDAQITDANATTDINITRSGPINAPGTYYSAAINTDNKGSGATIVEVNGDISGGISALSQTGAVTIAGTGNTTRGIAAFIFNPNSTSGITVTRSGTLSDTGNGVYVSNYGTDSGAFIKISGLGAVIAGGGGSEAIRATAAGGSVDIGGATGLSSAVSGAFGINAYSGTGAVVLKTTAGGTVSGTRYSGINAGSGAGATHITIGAAVSGQLLGVGAYTREAGALSVTTLAGGTVTGTSGVGIGSGAKDGVITLDIGADVSGATDGIATVSGGTGATNVAIRSGAAVTGGANALNLTTKTGNVTVNNAGTLAGAITGVRIGSGTITLNNSGTVKLLGAQTASAAVATVNKSGGVLTGTSSFLGAVSAESGSFIRPGDRSLAAVNGVPQMGTLTAGSLTLAPGATVEIRGDASGVNDKLAVTGNAVLGGATLKLLASPTDRPSWSIGKTYTVLTAGTVSGTLALTTDLVFLKPTAEYGATDVKLSVKRSGVTFDSVALSPTQRSVAFAIESQQDTQSTVGLASIDVLANLTAPQATAALETLSGSGATGALTTTGAQVSSFTRVIATQSQSSPLSGGGAQAAQTAFTGSDMPLAYGEPLTTASAAGKAFKDLKTPAPAPAPVSPAQAWRIWASVFGASHSTDANVSTRTPGVTGHDWGGATGFEMAVNPNLTAGVALGGSTSPFSAGKRATFGDSTGAMGSVYGTADFDRTYVTAALGYGRFETSTTRVVAIQGSPTERQTANYGTDAFTGFIELGYRIPVQGMVVTPFASFQPSVLSQGAATETSEMANPLFGLSYGARDTVSLPASLGLQVQRSFALGEWDTTVEARAAWVHEFQPDRGLRASFVSLPGGIFTASGVAASEDLARLSSTITLTRASGISLFARVGADVASNQRSYSGQGGVKFAW